MTRTPSCNSILTSLTLSTKWENAEKWLYCHHAYNIKSPNANHERHSASTTKKPQSPYASNNSCQSVHLELFPDSSPSGSASSHNESKSIVKSDNGIVDQEEHLPIKGWRGLTKDASTEVSPSASKRDMGTQMTPDSSPCSSPIKNSSPPRHNTPVKKRRNTNVRKKDIICGNTYGISIIKDRDHLNHVETLEECHMSKLTLINNLPRGSTISLQSSDAESPVHSSENVAMDESCCAANDGKNIVGSFTLLESRTAAWEDAERAKCNAEFKRERARIEAWENLQRARAEAELKRVEVKLEKQRAKAMEKAARKITSSQGRAEKMRAAAESKQSHQMSKLKRSKTPDMHHVLLPCNCFCRWLWGHGEVSPQSSSRQP